MWEGQMATTLPFVWQAVYQGRHVPVGSQTSLATIGWRGRKTSNSRHQDGAGAAAIAKMIREVAKRRRALNYGNRTTGPACNAASAS